jgi:hypothetical protein
MRKLAAPLLLTVLSLATVTGAEAAGPFVITTSAPVAVVSSFGTAGGPEKTGNGTWDATPPVSAGQPSNGTWDGAAG